jgi:hypothetical protein
MSVSANFVTGMSSGMDYLFSGTENDLPANFQRNGVCGWDSPAFLWLVLGDPKSMVSLLSFVSALLSSSTCGIFWITKRGLPW